VYEVLMTSPGQYWPDTIQQPTSENAHPQRYCSGDRRQVFRHVIVRRAAVRFHGLQIRCVYGSRWWLLKWSGQYGLGFVINTSYTMVRYPTIVIGMITLGIVGYSTSALVRIAGNYLMRWRTRELALGAQ